MEEKKKTSTIMIYGNIVNDDESHRKHSHQFLGHDLDLQKGSTSAILAQTF